jgi:hypothetical protein
MEGNGCDAAVGMPELLKRTTLPNFSNPSRSRMVTISRDLGTGGLPVRSELYGLDTDDFSIWWAADAARSLGRGNPSERDY